MSIHKYMYVGGRHRTRDGDTNNEDIIMSRNAIYGNIVKKSPNFDIWFVINFHFSLRLVSFSHDWSHVSSGQERNNK